VKIKIKQIRKKIKNPKKHFGEKKLGEGGG
jgi:hypothetical protein